MLGRYICLAYSHIAVLTCVLYLVQVDLEHNQYRSFQGLTCLIQISTRTEDYVIDALKLRVQIGPYLREIFKDPTKRKVDLLLLHDSIVYLLFFFEKRPLQNVVTNHR